MPKLDEVTRKARRERILTAAYRCFARKGFGRTTMRDICGEAGFSLGGVYVHFDSKEALMAELAAIGRDKTKELLVSVPPERDRAVGPLLDSLLRQLNAKECRESTRLDIRLWGEALHTPVLKRLVVQAFENVRKPFEDAARRAQQSGDLPRAVRAETAARAILSIFLGLAVQKAIEPSADIEGCAAFVRSVLLGRHDRRRRRK